MSDLGPADILYRLVRSQLDESATLADVEALVEAVAAAAGIPEDVAEEVLDQFRTEYATDAAPPPRLLVDWGEVPRVGHQVRPEFSLLCPAYSSRPDIAVRIDQDLDHDTNDSLCRPEHEATGVWAFHVPFRMTTDAMDCRPGQYLIDVRVSFRDVPPELPRFFRCRIRIKVSHANAEEDGILEIDGDGQSIVNLQGYNLKQFSKVVLKGGQDSVINLQDAVVDSSDSGVTHDGADKPVTTFEYELKVDTERQSRLPSISSVVSQRAYLDSAGLRFEDGRRTLVYTRPRLSLGRSRDNDVVLRFLPSNEENDSDSRNISRTHFLFELTSEGVEIRDESRSGIELNYSVVQDRAVLDVHDSGDVTAIDLGVTGSVPNPFRLEMLMFAPEHNVERRELEFWDELYCELVGARLTRLARQALDIRLDAVRFDRVENLAGEEAYVLLLREALIGGSPSQSAIILKDSGPQPQARLLHMDRSFWLEPQPGVDSIRIDATLLKPGTLTPLTPGMRIQFGSEIVTFERPEQLYLN